jgi:hypothetical protein
MSNRAGSRRAGWRLRGARAHATWAALKSSDHTLDRWVVAAHERLAADLEVPPPDLLLRRHKSYWLAAAKLGRAVLERHPERLADVMAVLRTGNALGAETVLRALRLMASAPRTASDICGVAPAGP